MRYGERHDWKALKTWFSAGGYDPQAIDHYHAYYDFEVSEPPPDVAYPHLAGVLAMLRVEGTDDLPARMLSEAGRFDWGTRGSSFFEGTSCHATERRGCRIVGFRGAGREIWEAVSRGALSARGVNVKRVGTGLWDFLYEALVSPDVVGWLDTFESNARHYQATKNLEAARHSYEQLEEMVDQARRQRAAGEPYFVSPFGWRLTKMIEPRADLGVGDTFEYSWAHLRSEYLRVLPDLHESERIWYEWSQERSAREQWARMRLDLRHEGPQFTSFEGLGPRVSVAKTRITPEQHAASVLRRMDGYGFLAGQKPLALCSSESLLTKSWIQEVGFPAQSTVLQLETSADFIDSDIAKIDLTVVYGSNAKGKGLIVWLPRAHAEYDYGKSARDFDLNLRMVHRELDEEYGMVTASPMIPREHRGSAVNSFEFHKYRSNPSPFGCGAYLPA